MRRKRMWTGLALGIAMGLPVGIAAEAIGGDTGVIVGCAMLIALCWPVAILRIYYALPRRCRAVMEKLLDPSAGPPEDAEPIALDVPQRWARALTTRDWLAAQSLMDADFAIRATVDSGPRGRRIYLRGLRQMAMAYPDLRVQVDDVRAEPEAPEIMWVRFSEVGRPRRGPELRATWWERWRLDPAHKRVREMSFVGVTQIS